MHVSTNTSGAVSGPYLGSLSHYPATSLFELAWIEADFLSGT